MNVINGHKIAQEILSEQKAIIQKSGLKPKLVSILVGNNSASEIYIQAKRNKAQEIGIEFKNFHLSADVQEKKILQLIQKLNNDKNIHGIIVQLPLPKKFNAGKIIKKIYPQKDADGFHPENIKKFLKLKDFDNCFKQDLMLPVTAAVVIELLNRIRAISSGLYFHRIAVIGKSSVFVTPLIHYFKLCLGVDLQIISPDDPDLSKKVKQADVVITACGRPKLITKQMIKKGAIVIDVGISRVNDKVAGDVDFDQVANKALFITPVPGGVGPITVAILMRNVVQAALIQTKQGLRNKIKKVRNEMVAKEVEVLSSKIIKNLLRLPQVKNVNSFFIYISKDNEVQTHDLIRELLRKGKVVTVPKILIKDVMQSYQVTNWSELKPDKYGILTPISGSAYKGKIDICIAPCVAVTKKGHRLGMGQGYYDRFISAHSEMRVIALAYNKQIVPYIPIQEHDKLVDIIVTEDKVIRK